ncbi:MAG: Bcr/CflA family drug resistance efflux transporter [Burkholderiales bacterium 28-67-8]|nr:MAG: Bcr/CflA family drug resistance efflux transporter [Burkholderiales bacterium 28-67-8]
MNPDASTLWPRPRWALALLLAGLASLGPFSIDTYLPAFAGIAASIGATPVEMQQTLSAYLFGFAVMNLFHGALSDSLGRRPVVLWGIAVFTLASAGCALSPHVGALMFFRALQGMASGAGAVVSRAVIRDMHAPADAQKMMSQVTLFFGIAPMIAPLIGGLLFVHVGWPAVFWFLAAVGAALWIANHQLLPETLHRSQRQPLNVRNLLRGYRQLGASPRFIALTLASGLPFNGMFLYVLSAPVFLGEHLHMAPEHFFWLFILIILGIMSGAFVSGRIAGRVTPRRQIRDGFLIMLAVSVVNVSLNLAFAPSLWWSMWPIAVFSLGWALMTPAVTLLVLDQAPDRRGMAASLQACIASMANGVVAGVVAPLVMHSIVALALTAMALMCIGGCAWFWVRTRLAGPL